MWDNLPVTTADSPQIGLGLMDAEHPAPALIAELVMFVVGVGINVRFKLKLRKAARGVPVDGPVH